MKTEDIFQMNINCLVNNALFTKYEFLLKMLVGASLLTSTCTHAEQLSPPPYELKNRHHVNLASGHVSPSLEDVKIGGAMGLAHTISSYSSNFVSDGAGGAWGYNDNFKGGVYKRLHHPRSSIAPDELYVLTAYESGSSTDFLINADGETFTARGDTRYTLKFVINPSYKPDFIGFEYTKPDGTVIFYAALDTNHDFRPINNYVTVAMSEIKYPTGLTVTINHQGTGQWAPISSVRTNTGFQLKYVYVLNNTPAYSPEENFLPAADSLNWSSVLPKYIWALNNAIDYCPPEVNNFALAPNQACPAFTKQWPTVTYEWPNGMPRAMYQSAGVFKVTDASGGVTEYRHTPHSTYLRYAQENPNVFVPRLTSIKHSRSNVADINYEYQNTGTIDSSGLFPTYQAGPTGQLKRSWVGDDSANYNIGMPGRYGGMSTNAGGGYRSVRSVGSHALYGPHTIELWDKTIYMEYTPANKIRQIYKLLGGIAIDYDYDSRGNINSITENEIVVSTAEYPSTCDASNQKYCNQATWVRDAKGNQTDYTYHAESGQIATITLPANKHGIRAQTRYKYEQKYAKYFTSPGNKTTSNSPIWLKTEEKYCINSAVTESGGCSGNDEVTTRFEYEHDNLLMTGMIVKSQKDNNKTLRTCYQYDVYGNRIGETQPKANLSSCN